MACTTFHPFTRLPIEIRLEIWETACLEQRRGYRAIHYMAGHPDHCLIPSDHTWDDSNTNDNTKTKNNSVYLWHAGLWAASSESRKVVLNHWRSQVRSTDRNFAQLSRRYSGRKSNYYMDLIQPGEEGRDPAAPLPPSDVHHEHWRQILYPEEDIFCITANGKEALQYNWPTICGKFPVSLVKNIAFEWHPSWNIGLPVKPDFPAMRRHEKSPFSEPLLTMFRRWVFESAILAHRGNALLIDNNAKWISREPGLKPTIFDLNGQYYEIPVGNTRRPSPTSLVQGSAILQTLEYLEEGFFSFVGLFGNPRTRAPYTLQDTLSILVRWENRVEC
ncbi:hypothetical protein FPOAC2_09642 [Fusarium poae]|jgi:hypothetical protein|uniref:hypothetical protein n=1 Tax=Fusarium poae TaxID=36050 RepID=UPI001CE834F9|nr:hypothetical protein FPOAC1_009700 [Fusarium poae]KAG8670292.1 hypothetical protein FPOAC1_009700 [Fusarium poae]